MSDIEEQSKRTRAAKVITPKRKYFVLEHNVEVEADDAIEAAELAQKQADKLKGKQDE